VNPFVQAYREANPLKDMARAAKQREQEYEKRKKDATTYGVFRYDQAGQYPAEKAVKVFAREVAAEKHASALNEEVKSRLADWGPSGYVVRPIVGDF
jgi:hypothetical protein